MPGTVQAVASYNPELDTLVARIAPGEGKNERVSDELEIYRSRETNEIIGVTVWNVAKLLAFRRKSKAPPPPENASLEEACDHYRRDYEEHPEERTPLPSVWYNRAGDCIEIIFENGASVAQGLPNHPVTTHRDRKTKKLVGLDINKVTALIRATP